MRTLVQQEAAQQENLLCCPKHGGHTEAGEVARPSWAAGVPGSFWSIRAGTEDNMTELSNTQLGTRAALLRDDEAKGSWRAG